MRHDKIVLFLLWCEMRNALRGLGRFDRVFFCIAGGLLAAYNLGGLFLTLRANAAELRDTAWLWHLALPSALISLGAAFGAVMTGISLSRAFAACLLALPLSFMARRRMVARATLAIALVAALAVGLALGLCGVVVGKHHAVIWGVAASAWFFLGAVFGLLARMQFLGPERQLRYGATRQRRFPVPGLTCVDGARPAWLGSWACGLEAGRLRITAFMAASLAVLVPMDILSGGASLAEHQAAPAAIDSVITGLAVFMLSLRCQPLDSPVLRSAPLRFMRCWLGVMRLPLVLSAIFFAMPAGAAIAAEPHSWAVPVGGGFSLLLLDGAYAVFAAYFMMTPFVAAISFILVLSYAAYKWLQYHDVVYAGLAVFLIWLWRQTRRRFLHG